VPPEPARSAPKENSQALSKPLLPPRPGALPRPAEPIVALPPKGEPSLDSPELSMPQEPQKINGSPPQRNMNARRTPPF
jgi:hypothetical protein